MQYTSKAFIEAEWLVAICLVTHIKETSIFLELQIKVRQTDEDMGSGIRLGSILGVRNIPQSPTVRKEEQRILYWDGSYSPHRQSDN